jgi:hypothetical protein
MPDIEVEIDDDEDIIRVYTRKDVETWGLAQLRQADFARVMAAHSGLSMWQRCNDQFAMDRLPTDKRKGTAKIKAKVLKDLGLKFFAQSPTAEHLSVRCVGCNFEVDYEKGLCKRADDTPCGFDIVANSAPTSKILANKKRFKVSVPIT